MKFVGLFIITTLAALLGAFVPTAVWVAHDGGPAGWILAIGAGAFLFTFPGTLALVTLQALVRDKWASKKWTIAVTLVSGLVLGGLMLGVSSPTFSQGALIGSMYGAATGAILLALQLSRIGSTISAKAT